MRRAWSLLMAIIILSPLVGSIAAEELPSDVKRLNDSIRQAYAPDKRVAVWDIDYTVADKSVMLRGRSDKEEATELLVARLRQMGYFVVDAIEILPNSDKLGEKIYAIVNLSSCALRAEPNYSAEMVTQALLGMPAKVVERDGWYRIQTPDGYLAWTHRVGIHLVDKLELSAWNAAEKVVVTAPHGWVYSQPDNTSQVVSDVVGGCRLAYEGESGGYYKVVYPDSRVGYIAKQIAAPERKWRESLKQDAASIIATAKTMMGVPYLWGGTSAKGVDCSGLVRTTLFMHDIIIPRDASQQAYTGEHIDIAEDFSNLQPGDLLFFGSKATSTRKERVVHVAIYMGEKLFIHSQGDVHISSFDKQHPLFDQYNLNRLLFAARVLPYIDKEPQLYTTPNNPFYKL